MQPKPKLPGPKGPAKPLPGKAPGAAGPRPAMARPGAGPRPAGMASARPYGHAPVGRARGGVQHRFLMLGIPFLVLNGLGLLAITLLVLILFVIIGSVATEAGGSGAGGMIAGLAGLIVVVCLMFLGYVITAGILCIKGRPVGWWMAMVYSGIGALLQVIGLLLALTGPKGGEGIVSPLIGFLFSAGIITLGIFDMKAYKAKQAAAPQGGQPMPVQPRMGPPGAPAAPRPRGNTSVRMAPSARMKAPGAPAPAPEAAPAMAEPVAEQFAEQVVEAPQPAGPPPNATHPKAAAVQILALAANVEPELAPARLEKARAAATKLLGEGSSADMDAWMTSPLPVADFGAQMAEVADLVGGNAKLAQGVIKCAQFALKAADGSYTDAAQAALDAMQQQFPAPQPVQAPPAAVAPAPPPIQAAPPPVYAPAPPPAGIAAAPPPAAPGVALPRQRKRRPGYR